MPYLLPSFEVLQMYLRRTHAQGTAQCFDDDAKLLLFGEYFEVAMLGFLELLESFLLYENREYF